MLRYVSTNIEKEKNELPFPLEVSISKSLEAPADELVVTFPQEKKLKEMVNIEVFSEKEEKVFSGIVDEQKFFYETSGSFCNLTARSKVSLLLDNEALPGSYTLPSLEVIFKNHVKPYGFTSFLGNNKVFAKEFIITKGMSEYEVLETFCSDYLGVTPRFLNDDILDATGNYKKSSIVFSNEIKGATKYSSIYENIKRYKQYSEIYIKAGDDTNYSLNVKNEKALSKGVLRKRYLNVSNYSKIPIEYGEKILKNSNKNAYELVVSCPGKVSLNPGDLASLKDSSLKNLGSELLVYKTLYSLDNTFEKTVVTLIEKD